MIKDVNILVIFIGLLLSFAIAIRMFPDNRANFEFIIFFLGMFAMIVIARMIGFSEGILEGHETGLKQGYDEALNGGGC